LDYLGLNHYSTHYVLPTDGSNGWLDGDANIRSEWDPAWNTSGIGWTVVPWGLRRVINWIDEEYKLPIYITENGYGAQEEEMLNDNGRVDYYKYYINEVMKAVILDQSDVRSYTAWSVMDNFEWGLGYT